MDFRQLETFIEVVKLKSFSKAAEKLFITQPTVTNHIQNLEKELGTLLINRLGKNITLTDAGNLLYKYAINIINSLEMAKFDLAIYQGKIQGHLDIMSSSVPRKYLLPNLINSFLNIHPDVSFNLTNNDSKEVVSKILDGETDFGIVGNKIESSSLIYIEIMEDNLLLITPNTFSTNSHDPTIIEIEHILDQKFIFREEGSGTRDVIEKHLENNGVDLERLHIIAYIEDSETIKELVALGAGISFLSEKDALNGLKLEKYKSFNIKGLDFKRKFYFVYHKNRQLSPLGETFKNHVLEYTKDPSI